MHAQREIRICSIFLKDLPDAQRATALASTRPQLTDALRHEILGELGQYILTSPGPRCDYTDGRTCTHPFKDVVEGPAQGRTAKSQEGRPEQNLNRPRNDLTASA